MELSNTWDAQPREMHPAAFPLESQARRGMVASIVSADPDGLSNWITIVTPGHGMLRVDDRMGYQLSTFVGSYVQTNSRPFITQAGKQDGTRITPVVTKILGEWTAAWLATKGIHSACYITLAETLFKLDFVSRNQPCPSKIGNNPKLPPSKD